MDGNECEMYKNETRTLVQSVQTYCYSLLDMQFFDAHVAIIVVDPKAP